jgi:ergothioneine biosynthesis protein EgtB
MSVPAKAVPGPENITLFHAVRRRSQDLCRPLEIEDMGVQPMSDASPPKWHLAHTTWFFETFILRPFDPTYRAYNSQFEYLFNSYYNGVGKPFPRGKRGNLSRPTVKEVYAYREQVDAAMERLLEQTDHEEVLHRTELGINHEQQHQELILTDLKYNLGHNPLYPAYRDDLVQRSVENSTAEHAGFIEFEGGLQEVGAGSGFSFDNELPRHQVYLPAYALAQTLTTNAEYLAFIEDGGYSKPGLWLSEGWAKVEADAWSAPLYWKQIDGVWFEYTLGGLCPLRGKAPVTHISAFEADAYARWAGARLPTEYEWECAVGDHISDDANLFDAGCLHPQPGQSKQGLQQCFGDGWEWTSSSYGPYPGYRTLPGTLGEYNGKFMASQLVLRGGSCVTPASHIRRSYRNFFYPPDRWQFSSVRLARDV